MIYCNSFIKKKYFDNIIYYTEILIKWSCWPFAWKNWPRKTCAAPGLKC